MRVRLENPPWDYDKNWRDHRWDAAWIERPRLWASAVALALGEPTSVCDPACGDAAVVMTAHMIRPIEEAHLADLSINTLNRLVPAKLPFKAERAVADIETTLRALHRVDAIVLTEILEHLADPDSILALARTKARWLVASSPVVPDGNDHTTQHLWAFDEEGYRDMLEAAGWEPRVWFTANAKGHPYVSGFQIWGCE